MIVARAPSEDEKVNDSTFTVTLITSILAAMTIIMYAYILPNVQANAAHATNTPYRNKLSRSTEMAKPRSQ